MSSAREASPLRYPGGKARLTEYFKNLFRHNDLEESVYAEPYAGGCGLGLNLLFSGYISRLIINDFDRSIWSFWHSVLNYPDELCDLIDRASVNVGTWKKQKEIQKRKAYEDPRILGFSTLFLNRTNRSGIIHSGGCIGGLAQRGKYKIDCRFNKEAIKGRIQRIHKYRNRISLTFQDAEEFIFNMKDDKKSFLYIDPPYFEKGRLLYKNSYERTDHSRLAQNFQALNCPYVITYDDVQGIRELYCRTNWLPLELQYSAQTKRTGREIIVFGNIKPLAYA